MIGIAALGLLLGFLPRSDEAIAYSRLTDGFWQIWTVRPDGRDETRWTSGGTDKRHPTWSANGDFLLFTDSHGALYRVDRPGGEPVRLLAEQSPISEPDLDADDRIAYLHVRQEPGYLVEIWTSKLNGDERRLMTHQPLRQLEPAWSPDGRRLAAAQYDPVQRTYALVVMNADATGERALVAGVDRVIAPSWSPDGRALAYALQHDDDHDLWLVTDDGGTPRRLTHEAGLDVGPVFSPDGREILFVSRRSGALQLWKLPLSGGAPTRLTRGDAPCREPAWFAPPVDVGPQIHSVSLSSHREDLRDDESLAVRFAIDDSADVALEISDEEQRVVRVLRSAGALSPGEHELTWDGRYDDGTIARDGVHVARLTAHNARGTSTWEPTSDTGGTPLSLIESNLDAERHRIRFSMSAPGWVRVRVGLDAGPHLATPLDWVPIVESPAFVDYSGDLPEPWGSFWDQPDRAGWAIGYAFPQNAFLVQGGRERIASAGRRPTFHASSERELSSHARHARDLCRDPSVSASLAGEHPRDELGRPIVDDSLTLVVDASSPGDRAMFEQSRFEVMIYVDRQFLMEDEDSALPFHYTLDVQSYPEGVHAFLVNVGAYGDHSAAAFVAFRIKRGAAR